MFFNKRATEEKLEELKQREFSGWMLTYVSAGMTRGEIFDDWIREMVRGPVVKSYPRHSLVFDDSDMHSIASWTKYSPLHLLQRRFSVVVIFVNWGHKNLLGSQSSLLKAGEENEVTCVLWFLNPDSYGETPDKQKAVV
ncbi:hypothetical protein YC2023_052811 [Brassica napus]